jgi:hypothetical protein
MVTKWIVLFKSETIPRCGFCGFPTELGHPTYCPFWPEWYLEQLALAVDDDDQEELP